VRDQAYTTFTAVTYAGVMQVVMNYDRYHFTPEAARELLNCVTSQMERTIAEAR
jgi:hypothetical protein